MELSYRPVDADNHYYESLDAFTRHQPPGDAAPRRPGAAGWQAGLRLARRQDQPLHPEPHVRPGHRARAAPSCSSAARSRRVSTRQSLLQVEPHARGVPRPRGAARVLDEQGLAAALMFPTLGCGVEQGLRADPEATAIACPRSTGGWKRTGASPTRTASSPHRCSRWPTRRPRSSSCIRCWSAARG